MPTQEQLDVIFNRVGYKPTDAQKQVHYCPARIRLVAGGERSGKSYSAAMDLLARIFYGKLFWLVAADYARTGAEFRYIVDGLSKLGLRFTASKQVDPGEIQVEGGIVIATKSTKDPRKIAMDAPDGIVVCEASQIDYESFLRLRGRLVEKRGWMLLAGTFENSVGWYPQAFQRGQAPNNDDLVSFSLPTWSNTHIFPGGREDPEIKRIESMSTPEWFMERFGGVPTPPKGMVFPEFRQHIHVGIGDEFEFDPAGLVHIFVDPGYATAYAVLAAQKRGQELVIIDEIFERGLVTSDIIKIAKQRPWWNKVIGGCIDIAGTQHQAMPAPSEIWLKESGVVLRSQKLRIQDGIEAIKRMLLVNPLTGKPLLKINARCRGLISEFGGGLNPIDETMKVYAWRVDRDGNVIGDVPEDKNNHAIKALSYGVVDLFGYSMVEAQKPKIMFW